MLGQKDSLLVVFDMDGTLYDLTDVMDSVYDMQLSFVQRKTGMSKNEVIALFSENGIFPRMVLGSKSATQFFARQGYGKEEWKAFKEEHFPVEKIDIAKAMDGHAIMRFKELGSVSLVTTNSAANAKRILDRLNIPLDMFDAVITSDSDGFSYPSKKQAMATLLARFGVQPQSAISIGDRFNTDILPMLELGGRGIMLNVPWNIHTVFEDMLADRLKTCGEYSFFSSVDDVSNVNAIG